MDCREAAELMDSFILGALDPGERVKVEAHIDGCPDCERRLQQDGELVVQLAYAVPRLVVPDRVRTRLFERIDIDEIDKEEAISPQPPVISIGRLLSPLGSLGRFAASHGGLAVAAALAVVVVVGGVWFNDRLDNVSEENSVLKSRLDDVTGVDQGSTGTLASQMEEISDEQEVLMTKVQDMAEAEDHMMDMIEDQRELAYMLASPDKSVSVLTSTSRVNPGAGAGAQGMIIFEGEGGSAFLTARELPANEEGSLYRVWLVKDGVRHDAGVFSVDSTGYGQTVIIPVGPWDEIDALEITAEPTGQSILQGDL